jgi:hypothetical protein
MGLPAELDLRELGIEPSEVTSVALLRRQHGHALYRLAVGARSLVLKWFEDPARALEVRGYALLERLGVPVLPVPGRTPNALLMEDLETSPAWRLATEEDTQRRETGTAVATWYLALHEAGEHLLADTRGVPAFLRRQEDTLDAASILRTGERLGLAAYPVWALAAEHVEVLKCALRSLPVTLTYNDFHWTNLALSRRETPAPRAIVFDYHLLGIGTRYSDYRNVSGALGASAALAFRSAYGQIDEREAILDAPIAVLYALMEALERSRLPRWAAPLVGEVATGELEAKLRRALALL